MDEPQGYLGQSRNLLNGLVFVLPALLLYQAGLVITRFEGLNGADFITLFVLSHFGLKGLVIFNLSLIAVFIVAIERLRQGGKLQPSFFLPVLLESFIYASLLGSVILTIMQKGMLFGVSERGFDPFTAVVLSLGAGVNEELVFRLALICAIQFSFTDLFGLSRGTGAFGAIVLSSLAFSAAHYIGPAGDVLQLYSFVFRFLAGLCFAFLFHVRGFAVAVYTHVIYDVLVLVA